MLAQTRRIAPWLLLPAIFACTDLETDDGDHGVVFEDTTLMSGSSADTMLLPEVPAVIDEQTAP